jgi:hypothetical protein
LRELVILRIFIVTLGNGFSWYGEEALGTRPIEWLCGSATYKKWQPMIKGNNLTSVQ